MFQKSLFEAPFLGYNRAIKALLKLKSKDAANFLSKWEETYPNKKDTSLEWALIRFLSEKNTQDALLNNPLSALKLWEDQWEIGLNSLSSEKRSLAYLFRKEYFSTVANTILQQKQRYFQHPSLPLLLCLIRGEKYNEALKLGNLLARIEKDNHSRARLLAYLGDACWGAKLYSKAKEFYLFALCETDDSIDIANILNKDVKDIIFYPADWYEKKFGEEIELEGPPGQWGAAIGLLTDFFHFPTIYDLDTVKKLKERIFNFLNGKEPMEQSGKIFAICLIASEQKSKLLERADLNIRDIRLTMKNISEKLFSRYMRSK